MHEKHDHVPTSVVRQQPKATSSLDSISSSALFRACLLVHGPSALRCLARVALLWSSWVDTQHAVRWLSSSFSSPCYSS